MLKDFGKTSLTIHDRLTNEIIVKLHSLRGLAEKKMRRIATACEHTYDGKHMHRPFYPSWNESILAGVNTISSQKDI